jgi:hypothetical protein
MLYMIMSRRIRINLYRQILLKEAFLITLLLLVQLRQFSSGSEKGVVTLKGQLLDRIGR